MKKKINRGGLFNAADMASFRIADFLQRAGNNEGFDSGEAIELLEQIRADLDAELFKIDGKGAR